MGWLEPVEVSLTLMAIVGIKRMLGLLQDIRGVAVYSVSVLLVPIVANTFFAFVFGPCAQGLTFAL